LGRPVSIVEMKRNLAERPELSELWGKVRGKSVDYVRVTLSTTPEGVFSKFECPREQELSAGESSKKLFWGLCGAEYDAVWRPSEGPAASVGSSSGSLSRRAEAKAARAPRSLSSPSSSARIRSPSRCLASEPLKPQSHSQAEVSQSRVEIGIQARPSSIDSALECLAAAREARELRERRESLGCEKEEALVAVGERISVPEVDLVDVDAEWGGPGWGSCGSDGLGSYYGWGEEACLERDFWW
jgi:hypothetical protein